MPDDWWNIEESTKVVIKGGNIVNADGEKLKDVKIKSGKIIEISKEIKPDDDAIVLDAQGMLLMPGGIDPNTHFDIEHMDTRTIDDFYYGTRAAVAGGTTTIIDSVVPNLGESLINAYKERRKIADRATVCDYCLHMTLTWWDKVLFGEMKQIVVAGGINSFRMYMSYRDSYMLDDTEIYQVCSSCKYLGALAMIQAENGSVIEENVTKLLENGIRRPEGHYLARPETLEAEAVNRACIIADQMKCPLYLCSIMSESAADVVKEKKSQGYNVFGETLAAALGTTAPVTGVSFKTVAGFITSPPISTKFSTPSNLMKRLPNGDLFTTASSHCTFTCSQKAIGKWNFSKIPHGVNGVEERMSIVWEKGVNAGILTPSQFVAVTSTNAAKLFNLYPKKGVIAVGSDADIVVWNPKRHKVISCHQHKQACDFNIFHGMTIHGNPEYVLVRGKLCVDSDLLRVEKGFGRYIHKPCYSKLVYPNHDRPVNAK